MEQKRLIVFGCSFAYGHGLQDCWDQNNKTVGQQPSKLGWPNKLAKLLGIQTVINVSYPGASNSLILRRILEFDFQEKDIAVILWTNTLRQTMYKNKDTKSNFFNFMPSLLRENMPDGFWQNMKMKTGIKPNELKNFVKQYYEVYHEDTDCNIETAIRINYAHSYLKKQKIKSYHLQDESQLKDEFDFMFMNDIKWKQFNYEGDFKIDVALDIESASPHPGPMSQEWFSKNIYKWFFKK